MRSINTKYRPLFLIMIIVLTIGLSPLLFAKEEALRSKHKKRNPALLISTTTLMQKQKQGQRIILVDVRTKKAFESFRIPGSINIPLHFIKTKPFLKRNPLILINEGSQYTELEQECLRLREAGFQATILHGGLNAWKEKNGDIEGDRFAQADLNKMPPHVFYQEKDFADWIIMDLSPKQTAKRAVPQAVHVPLLGKNPEADLRKTFDRMKKEKNLPFLSVLIMNESGEEYREMKKLTQKAGLENVFYLKNGLHGYQDFVHNLALSWKAKDKRLKTVGGCVNCGVEGNEN